MDKGDGQGSPRVEVENVEKYGGWKTKRSELLGSDSGRVISAAVVAPMAFDVPLVVVERPLILYIANHEPM